MNTFVNPFEPAEFVAFNLVSAESPLFYHAPYAIYVSVPASASLVSTPAKDLLDRIAELKAVYSHPRLPDSTPPSDAAFQNAKDFISTLPLANITKPDIQVAADGEVNFHWTGPDFRIDLGFYGDGKFSYFGKRDGGPSLLGDDVAVKDGAPKTLLDLASALGVVLAAVAEAAFAMERWC